MARTKKRACRNCHSVVITKDEPCPICKRTDTMSPNFSGLFVVFSQKSDIAKKMNVKQTGMYAIRVRS